MYRSIVFPILSRIDAEAAHGLSLKTVRVLTRVPGAAQTLRATLSVKDPRLQRELFGLPFDNPIGLAAGFDKLGSTANNLSCLGFGHVEVGTVTPLPQAGRPKPRMFRLTQDQALINRIGFASNGCQAMRRTLSSHRRGGFVLGVNIGPNAENTDVNRAVLDYVTCYEALHEAADYFTINISSPNTQGLRLLHGKAQLQQLLSSFFSAIQNPAGLKPVLLKVSPDLTEHDLNDLVDVALDHPIAGLIATNTTLDRPTGLRSAHRQESGGLSGRPLAPLATQTIRTLFRLTGGRLPIIGVGGVFTAADVVEKMQAGASLVQVYTGLVYSGPLMVRRLNLGVLNHLQLQGLKSLEQLVGTS